MLRTPWEPKRWARETRPVGNGRTIIGAAAAVLASVLSSGCASPHSPLEMALGGCGIAGIRRGTAAVCSAVVLSVPRSEVDITWFENWLHTKVLDRIPRGRHDPE